MNPFLVDGCVAAGAVGPGGLLRRGLLLADLGHGVSEREIQGVPQLMLQL